MKITVEHEVADDPVRCVTHDGTTFEGSSICGYHGFRDQTHGPRRPVDRHKPKCKLFNCWLDQPYQKCRACVEACEKNTRS